MSIASLTLLACLTVTTPDDPKFKASQDAATYLEIFLTAGKLALEQKDSMEAVVQFDKAIELSEKNFGPDDLRTVWSIGWKAHTFYQERRYAEAEPLYRRMLASLEKKQSATQDELLKLKVLLASTLDCQNQFREGEAIYRQLLIDTNKTKSIGIVRSAAIEILLAKNLERQNKLDEAESICRNWIEVAERGPIPIPSELETAKAVLGNICYTKGDYLRARELFMSYLTYTESELAADKVSSALGWLKLGVCCERTNAIADAERYLIRGIESVEAPDRIPNEDLSDLLDGFDRLIKILKTSGREEDVVKFESKRKPYLEAKSRISK
jgi:tetratricopeptide (TPR) repeat protein